MKNRTGNLIAMLLLIAMIVASSTYWIMRLRGSALAIQPAVISSSSEAGAHISATEALFGAQPAGLSAIGDLRVTGVVIAANPDDCIAIVIESDQAGRSVRVGADVTPGIRLTEVHRRYVVLSDGVSSTRVNLPEGTTQQAAAPQNMSDAAPAVSGTGGLRGEPPHMTGNPDADANAPAATQTP